jgi:hypothetical protein
VSREYAILDPSGRNKLHKINFSSHLYCLLSTAAIAQIDVEDDDCALEDSNGKSRTELDSHANMPVVGKHAYVVSQSGQTAEVSPFTPDYEPMQIPVVDAVVQYDCPYDGKQYMLLIQNALHVPSMNNNLLPPFVLREHGIQINDTPKIQVDDPTVDNHSILFPETGFCIPLSLWGIFSYFPTSKPTEQTLNDSDEVYTLTPTKWNPHCDAYAANEENMLDWEGNIVEKKDRVQVILSDIAEDLAAAASVQVSSLESRCIDDVLQRSGVTMEEDVHPCFGHVPRDADQVASVLAGVSPLLNDRTLYDRMKGRADIGKFQAAIGSTNATDEIYLVSDDDETEASQADSEDDCSMSPSEEEKAMDNLF